MLRLQLQLKSGTKPRTKKTNGGNKMIEMKILTNIYWDQKDEYFASNQMSNFKDVTGLETTKGRDDEIAKDLTLALVVSKNDTSTFLVNKGNIKYAQEISVKIYYEYCEYVDPVIRMRYTGGNEDLSYLAIGNNIKNIEEAKNLFMKHNDGRRFKKSDWEEYLEPKRPKVNIGFCERNAWMITFVDGEDLFTLDSEITKLKRE